MISTKHFRNLFLLIWISAACTDMMSKTDVNNQTIMNTVSNDSVSYATFGAGCFWCVEAVFTELKGVLSVKPGYSGGLVKKPTYKEVCNGNTGHAEVCQISYDPRIISFDDLLEVFWQIHDPTTLNQQGNDIGTQYRSVVFGHSQEQIKIAQNYKDKLNDVKAYANPVVTEIVPFEIFYVAEDYHHNYYAQNAQQPYCKMVVGPKVEKFRKVFKEKLK